MKQFYIFTIVLLTLSSSSYTLAQQTVVATGLRNDIEGILFHGNNLYLSGGVTHKISKLDVTAETPNLTDVFFDIETLKIPSAFALRGNDLYIWNSGYSRISKINIDGTTPSLTDVVEVLGTIGRLAFKGTDLYISDFVNNKIYKTDIGDTNPTLTEVITEIVRPYGMAISGTDLYVTSTQNGKIYKIDLNADLPTTATELVTGLTSPTVLVLNGTDLYVQELSTSEIFKIDLLSESPTAINVLDEIFAQGLASKDGDLYISKIDDDNSGTILKYTPPTLGVEDHSLNSLLKIHPNPATAFIEISGITKQVNYTLYSILGAHIESGVISKDEKIDIQKLANGMYFLKFDNRSIFKFIKK